MNLLFELPQTVFQSLRLDRDETIEYCVPFDIDSNGNVAHDCFVAVTRRRLFVIDGVRILHELMLSECDEFRCEPMVGCGALVAVRNGTDLLLARCSMKHITRLAYVAKGANLFRRGKAVKVRSREKEKSCPNCGTAFNGGQSCPVCNGRRVTLSRFADLCRPYILRLILISALMLAASGCRLFNQQVQKIGIDRYLRPASGTVGDVAALFGVMLILTVAIYACTVAKSLLCTRLGARMSMDLRDRLFVKIQSLSMNFVSSRKPGELMNRITSDTAAVRDFMENAFGNMMSNLITMLGAVVCMFAINWKLAILAVVFCPAVIVMTRMFRHRMHRMFRANSRRNDQIKNRLQDVISGIRVVKSFGREHSEAEKFNELSGSVADTQSYNETFWAVFFPVITLAMGIGIQFVTYFGGIEVLGGNMTVGTLIQFTSYASMLYAPLRWMAHLPRMIMRMLNSLERIYDVLDEEPDVANYPAAKPHIIKGDIEFKNVSFGYNSFNTVLEDINLSASQGEMIGLVGASGTGKSTMINLLMRLYDPDEGCITVDGVDLRDIDVTSLHSQIGVVLQETFLFSGTILDNIRFSKPNATFDEIIRAAKMANAHDFITSFPDGYNTYIGEFGYNVSGGERQRIAIARAILCDPRILILDEATSSLDTESEALIQEAIERLTGGRTTFAIAHRLSTLRNATRLIVLDKKHIVETGTHDELMRRKGVYYRLVTAQKTMYSVDGDHMLTGSEDDPICGV